ncbi:hypothetical protein PR202_ga22785 [Eleusine coracana subsp. coracana]|uniref:C2H2-type domain-containing protein n=1 Tax=Eleusine coracana subsp. coracana TaxID=191504 RepID=A0AAV5D3K4_ELECO|nr:hypothetical protein QOZ80_9AG0693100 [Eleusine coracana subsp. coracana]GJN05177.1 hypothetical protein PR202_ga22785 [Eleusine coracana subsp. coracana]
MGHVETSGTSSNLLQFLSLSLSLASKVIVKQSKTKQRVRLDGEFQCRTCGRRFATFQALGGHRTSHKRPRVRADGVDLLLGARPGKGAAAKHVHRCHTCGKVFPTGQALGGHMRRHRTPAALETMPATMTSSSSSLSSGLTEEGDHDHEAEDLLPARTLIHFI